MMKVFVKKYYWIFLAALIVIIDQISKLLVSVNMKPYDEISVIPRFFSIFYVRNEGVAFGFLSGGGAASKIAVGLLTLVIVVVAVVILRRGKLQKNIGIVSAAMIIGGGVGNLIDRIFLHYVIDFFAFTFKNWQFAVFNVADIFVTVGTVLFLIYYLFLHKEPKKDAEDAAALD